MPETNPIIASFIRTFAEQHGFTELREDEQFEHLLAMLLFRKSIHERFSTSDVTTGDGETGIDGACVVLDGNLILTAEDASDFFTRTKQSSSVIAEMLFFQGKTSKSFSREQILGFGDAVTSLLRSDNVLPQDDYLNEVRDIYQVLVSNAAKLDLKKARCNLSFCCLGEWLNPVHPLAAMKKIKNDLLTLEFFATVEVLPKDRNDIRDLWADATRAQEASIPTVARFPFPAMPGVENAVVALVKAKDFVDKVLQDDTGAIRVGIFDQNIRDFEGLSNPVNQRMKNTIGSVDSKSRFGIMNNGITIIAKGMSPAADSYVLRNYQIINGCQTSNVLYQTRSQLDDSILLQVRLIQTTATDVLNDVVEATNSQTSIPEYQFLANSKLAVEVQEFFSSYPEDSHYRLHFERRKSELVNAEISNTRIVTIQDLARTFGAVFLEEPHTVARAPNQAFEAFSDKLFKESDSPLLYYTAAFAHYRLQLLKITGKLKIPERRLYWHVLTVAKRLAAGKLIVASQARRKQDQFCEKFLQNLWEPEKALTLFEKAYQTIQKNAGQITRDRLKRQTFTSEYLDALQQKNSTLTGP